MNTSRPVLKLLKRRLETAERNLSLKLTSASVDDIWAIDFLQGEISNLRKRIEDNDK